MSAAPAWRSIPAISQPVSRSAARSSSSINSTRRRPSSSSFSRARSENLAAIRGLAEIFHRRGALAEALKQYRAALALARNDPDLERTVDGALASQSSRKPAGAGVRRLSFEQMANEFMKNSPPPPLPVAVAPVAETAPLVEVAPAVEAAPVIETADVETAPVIEAAVDVQDAPGVADVVGVEAASLPEPSPAVAPCMRRRPRRKTWLQRRRRS